jgi:hypothetical protein
VLTLCSTIVLTGLPPGKVAVSIIRPRSTSSNLRCNWTVAPLLKHWMMSEFDASSFD